MKNRYTIQDTLRKKRFRIC